MSSFPKLIPAFTAHVVIHPPSQVGQIATARSLSHAAFVQDSGFVRSEPSYPIQLDAVFSHGADFIKADADGKFVRLDVHSLLQDKSGAFVRFNYTGIVGTEGPNGKVLRGEADAATTGFGDAFTRVVFEAGSPELEALQHKVYVASGRFIVEAGKPATVEYKISEVAA